ncbi:alpha-hydroxy acid oxidase [Rhizobium sp. SSA_523]|uniref:alpha-hydroxy acid oxidase n=1 Tax=Rhizobium sp. SSA_523 TaxID=2952477 RepID=UPI0020915338|nr:alpha-hydroxy acid oxidase [Rhizobium sp. SSA_523]MCO5734178.1 alpha-hydroxy-acid oxidizing protein [Rhizobium sp. SSA_523]WKC21541.1 alpha-hydroxy acid oxidase [Rhizobium sp. SSA_523]
MTDNSSPNVPQRIDDRYATAEKYTTLRGIYHDARRRLSDIDWNYLSCGTGDEVTLRENTAAFDKLRFEVPLFAGISHPDTRTRVLGFDLSFPAFIAPFGGGEAVFHPEGHLAIGRAAAAVGIQQMVPVAASHSLEEIAAASTVASIFQMTFVGDEEHVLDMIGRAKDAGYKYICVTYSPIRQWRERMMEDRFSLRNEAGPSNFGPGKSDPAPLQELLTFTEPRWTWAQAARVIGRSPLPCIVKGVSSVRDAKASLDAGAVGLYVSNYGGRTIDRTPTALETLPAIRKAVGGAVPIILDSGIRRGSDIAAAIALGADAVALGRLIAYGMAADGEYGVRRTLELLQREFWTTLGHLGCSSVSELTEDVLTKSATSA